MHAISLAMPSVAMYITSLFVTPKPHIVAQQAHPARFISTHISFGHRHPRVPMHGRILFKPHYRSSLSCVPPLCQQFFLRLYLWCVKYLQKYRLRCIVFFTSIIRGSLILRSLCHSLHTVTPSTFGSAIECHNSVVSDYQGPYYTSFFWGKRNTRGVWRYKMMTLV